MRKGKKYPCSICYGPVANNHKAVYCNFCAHWCHIKCNGISSDRYEALIIEPETTEFICLKCDVLDNFIELPFANLDEHETYINMESEVNQNILENINISLGKKDKDIIKRITDIIIESNDDTEVSKHKCKFYNVEKFNKEKFKNDKYLSVFHLNIASLAFHIDELKVVLKLLNFEFDIIAISETKITKDKFPSVEISIPGYQIEYTETEASKGGTLLYIFLSPHIIKINKRNRHQAV